MGHRPNMTILTTILLSTLFSVPYEASTPNSAIRNSPNLKRFFTSQTLRCNNPNNYKLVRDRDSEANYVNIIQGNKIKHSIKLPTGLTYNGFAVNWAKKTKAGFEISIEYGSRIYYEKEFNFVCRKGQFYLTKIRVNSFDKHVPENDAKYHTANIKLNIPLTKFKVNDYITEFGK